MDGWLMREELSWMDGRASGGFWLANPPDQSRGLSVG